MERDRLDFGNQNINKLFRALFLPTLAAMVFNSILNICDGMFVGHGVGSDALAAINIVAPFFLICTGIGLMFGIGASVISSIRLSEGNVKAARIIMTQAYLAGAVVFGTIILLTTLHTGRILALFGCSKALEPLATDYLLWLLPGLVFFYLQCAGMMLIRLDGSPKYAMSVQIVAAIINIFLDWLMVYPLGMGIMGASVATSISCVIGGLMVVVYFIAFSSRLKFYRLKVSMKSLRLSLRNTGYMVRVGFATLVAELSIGVMMVTGNFMFMKYMGEDGVAAFSVGCYLFPVIFSISNAVAQSSQPIISYNYGAKSMDRVKKALRLALATACACGLSITAVMWFGSSILASLFLPTEAPAYGIAVEGLPVLGCCALFFAINITFIGYYQSTEHNVKSTVFMLLRGIVFMIPGFVVLPGVAGDTGLWLAIPAAEALTLGSILATYAASRKRV